MNKEIIKFIERLDRARLKCKRNNVMERTRICLQLKGHRGQSDDRAEFIAKNLFENNGREYTTTEKINYLRVSLFYKGPRSVTKLKFERWKG